MNRYQSLNNQIQKFSSRLNYLKQSNKTLESQIEKSQNSLDLLTQTHELFKKATSVSLNNLKVWLEKILNSGVGMVFPEQNFRLELKIDSKGTEIIVYQNEKEVNLYDCGGGFLDIVNLILQLCLILLSKQSKILIADEPLKHLSEQHQSLAAKILNQLAEDLNVQIIMVTHSTVFANTCEQLDKVKIVKL